MGPSFGAPAVGWAVCLGAAAYLACDLAFYTFEPVWYSLAYRLSGRDARLA